MVVELVDRLDILVANLVAGDLHIVIESVYLPW
jgi:hypothetical protein